MEPHSSTGQGVTSDLLQLKYVSLYDWKKIDHVMFTVFYSWKSREIDKKVLDSYFHSDLGRRCVNCD